MSSPLPDPIRIAATDAAQFGRAEYRGLLDPYRGNMAVPRSFQVLAQDDDEEATILLYDGIGGWFGVEAQTFVHELNAIKAKRIALRINSPGGDVFDARATQVALRQHPAEVTAHVDGLAASAASYVMLGADKIVMARGAFLMVHRGWSLQVGNADDMAAMADLLGKIDEEIVTDYKMRTNQDRRTIRKWMADETWFSADDAKREGFVDEVFEPSKPIEHRFNLSAYDHPPADLTEDLAQTTAALNLRRRRLALLEQTAA